MIEPYKLPLVLMDAGTEIPVNDEKIQGIPESLVFDDGQEMTLSTWGKLVWTQSKNELLSQELLPFPHLEYRECFWKDYEKTKTNQKERVKLQETLAKVSCLLNKSNGDTCSNPSNGKRPITGRLLWCKGNGDRSVCSEKLTIT